NPYSATFMGSREILKGDKQCFNTVIGQKYHYDIYYCENIIFDKTCTDTDDLDYFSKGTVTFSTNPYNPQEFDDYCSSTTKLNERYCDIDDSVQTQVYTCIDKCIDGKCVVVTPTTKDITCYPLLANCDARTFTVDLADDCSDVKYNGYDVSSYGSQSDCVAIQNPPVPPSPPSADCDDWRFLECDGDDAKVVCFEVGSARYGDSRTVPSDYCSGDDLTATCNEWRDMGCDGDDAEEQCFDTDSKLYGTTQTVDSDDCPVSTEPTEDCDKWEVIDCVGDYGKEVCIDPLSAKLDETRLVLNENCVEGNIPTTNDFDLMDWIENNVVIVGGAMIGLIMLFTLLVVGVILMGKKK
ncbi:MAG: hypothetical protein KAS32_26430, partial [Candidatus Peribacteraceae bacterium]|nr:hypothetical protein [Candidatus Peribacteraceae bacterium]